MVKLSAVMQSDMERRVPAKVLNQCGMTLAGTRRPMSEYMTALSLAMSRHAKPSCPIALYLPHSVIKPGTESLTSRCPTLSAA